ncbi:hypothetical protein H0H93_002687 [Arthromyces matolae]|nr:hypothetical protein H0H93_002687 [Arthromyces matolae]
MAANLPYFVVDRVKWFRDRAARDRSREEKDILEEEFRRTVVSFTRMAEVWNQMASGPSPGSVAYAHKHAAMYNKLAQNCTKAFKGVKSPKTEDDLDSTEQANDSTSA